MKTLKITLLACCMLLLGACTRAQLNNRKAAGMADRLEQGESISAADYSEMVEFYCTTLDRALGELEPLAREHAAAVDKGDTELSARTASKLQNKTAEVQSKNKELTRLGSQLFNHISLMPDSIRTNLLNHIREVSTRYSDYH